MNSLSSSRKKNCTRRSICRPSHLLLTFSRSISHPGSSKLHFNSILLFCTAFKYSERFPALNKQSSLSFFSGAPNVIFPFVWWISTLIQLIEMAPRCGIRVSSIVISSILSDMNIQTCAITRIGKCMYSNPSTGLDRPWSFQEIDASRFQDIRYMKVERLPALSSCRLYPQDIFLVLISVRDWVDSRSVMRQEN